MNLEIELENVYNLFGKHKHNLRIFNYICSKNNLYASKISKDLNIDHVALWTSLKFLKKENLINSKKLEERNTRGKKLKEHRIKLLYPTKKGNNVYSRLKEIEEILIGKMLLLNNVGKDL